MLLQLLLGRRLLPSGAQGAAQQAEHLALDAIQAAGEGAHHAGSGG